MEKKKEEHKVGKSENNVLKNQKELKKITPEEMYSKVEIWAENWDNPLEQIRIISEIREFIKNSKYTLSDVRQTINNVLKVKKENKKNKKSLDIEEINKRLESLDKLSPLELDNELDKLVKESGKTKKVLKEQFENILNERREKQKKFDESKKILVKKAGNTSFSEKQFYLLKKYANPNNELIQQAIGLGLENINMNDIMKAHCKLELDKIMREIKKSKNKGSFTPVNDIENIERYEDIPVVRETEFEIIEKVFDGKEDISLSPLIYKKLYQIYSGSLGVGHSNIFIVAKPEEILNKGSCSLRLGQINFEEFYKNHCKEKTALLPNKKTIFSDDELVKYPKSEGFDTHTIFKKEFENRENRPFFFGKVKATSINNLVKTIETIGFENMLNDFILENGHIDPKLQYAFRIGKLTFGNKCSPEVSRYNPHCLIITNTKTGKSTQLGKQTKLKYDSGTASRLLGFSSGKETNEGDLDNHYKLVVLDDFSSANYQKEILDNLPSILENGKALIAKGKKTIETKCSSTFILTTNANNLANENELITEFLSILGRLSETPQRIGSRFACILFGNGFDEAKTIDLRFSKKDLTVNNLLIEQIFEEISSFILKLMDFKEIEMFLEEPNSEYRKTIESISTNEINSYGKLRDFWKATASGDRHQKGFALKQGILDFFSDNQDKLIELLREDYNPSEEDLEVIISLSNENLSRLNNHNIDSLTNIIKLQKTEEEVLENMFDNLRQSYLKALIRAFVKYMKKNSNLNENLIPIVSLGEFVDREDITYISISKIQEKLSNLDRINRDLRHFDFEIVTIEEQLFIQIYKKSLDTTFRLLTLILDKKEANKGVKSPNIPINPHREIDKNIVYIDDKNHSNPQNPQNPQIKFEELEI